MRPGFNKVTNRYDKASSVTKKILNIIESASKSFNVIPDFFPSEPDSGISKLASLNKNSSVIPLNRAMESGEFINEGLGVYLCSSDKSIWRIDKDAATGEHILVRNEEYDELEALVNAVMEKVSN